MDQKCPLSVRFSAVTLYAWALLSDGDIPSPDELHQVARQGQDEAGVLIYVLADGRQYCATDFEAVI